MDYFPTKLAEGMAFCNRSAEQKELVQCINNTSPVLLTSPRRYGKTSLAIHVLKKHKYLYVHIDLFKELSEEAVAKAILKGIGVLLGKIEAIPEKLINLAKDFFANFHLSAAFKKGGIEVEFGMKKKYPADIIAEALEGIEKLAAQKNKRLILFLDEIQVLSEITFNHSIEAAIRHAAQESKHISYVFSGSNRHLIEEMFNDRKRPLFKLCHSIYLKRITENDYKSYVTKVAKKIWKTTLPDNIINSVLKITERHPYYVNKLFTLLSFSNSPSLSEVNTLWRNYVLENQSAVEGELSLLALNQRKLLFALAKLGPLKSLLSMEITNSISLPVGSIRRTVLALKNKDFIFIDEDGSYRILDPLILSVLLLDY